MKLTNPFKILIIIVLAFWNYGCTSVQNDIPEGDFRFIVISDIHIKNKPNREIRLKNFVEAINNKSYPDVDFVITTGDNVSSVYDKYNPNNSKDGNNYLKKFVDIMNGLKIPKYCATGNHEYKIENDRDSDAPYETEEIDSLTKIWTQITGYKSYYSFVHENWKFIVMNSMKGRSKNRFFDEIQLEWLNKELKGANPTVLFFHHPIETDGFRLWSKPSGLITEDKEPDFYNIVRHYKNIIKGIFVGHGHMWVHDKLFDSIDVFETDSFGDNEDSPFYLIGVDISNKKLNVSSFTNN